MGKVSDMIKELIRALRDAGVQVPDDVAPRIEVRIQQQFGGERVYVAKSPKRAGVLQVGTNSFPADMPSREIARITGKPIRTVQRLKSGR